MRQVAAFKMRFGTLGVYWAKRAFFCLQVTLDFAQISELDV